MEQDPSSCAADIDTMLAALYLGGGTFLKVWLVITNFHVTCHPELRPTSTH